MKKDDDNASLLRRCLYKWYDYYYDCADFNEIASLCKELKLPSLSEVIKKEWKSNKEFRAKYLSCFPVVTLKEELPDFKGTKSELVEALASDPSTGQVNLQVNKPLLFSYCMTNEGSGADNLGSYLPRD